ncbi:amino acid ABC transporter [Jannaschia pagri]|uniref:Amino acid ABC transporter n=1 Tax=Jannaschia pagri TaxID=2829797 RepID=A0ABQ4NRR1_9RHOB|nr:MULTISPECIES: transporter substrate-binding domain-containing protein [unclassified Jannaschia]GIT93232.1 amino acid ABC transporter [Jannaschia sp. AI_61]GIT97101.1 amino acid ABC transporter [Jannaschia sp. AI_62]
MRTILAVAAVCFAGVSAHAQETLRVATEGFYAPFSFYDNNGDLAGFDVDIANALCGELQVTCEIVQNDWDLLIDGLNEGAYDAIVASMSITPEREEKVSFTLPYYSNMLTFVGKSGSGIEITPEGLAGKTVGALRSTVSSEYLEATYSGVVEARLYDTQDEALAALVAGDIDLVIGDNLPSYAWLQTAEGQGHEFIGEFIDINDRISIAVDKGNDALLDQLNEALIAIIENGTYQTINAKYFPFSIYF